MSHKYYTLPLRADIILDKKQHEECALTDSIEQVLHLIISSYQGESVFSDDFGCSIWDEEFNIQMNVRWKEDLCDSLKKAIQKFERRLSHANVKVSMEKQYELIGKDKPRLRRALQIEITAIINKTNDPFLFRDIVYISPLAQH